ncbi:MAG: CAP domain-containing protein [Anaerolineales bacterium]
MIGSFLLASTLIALMFVGFLSVQAMYGKSASEVPDFVVAMLFDEVDHPPPTPTITPTPPIIPLPPDEIVPEEGHRIIRFIQDPTEPPSTNIRVITATSSSTSTTTSTATSTPTETPTGTPTNTPTWRPWPTWTPSRTPTRTATRPYHTSTPSRTSPPPTLTFTPTQTHTLDPLITPSETSVIPPTDTAVPSNTPTQITTSCTTFIHSSHENTIVGLINNERQSRDLHALAVQGQLLAAARVHAADMACNGFHSHTGSDGSSVRDRVTRQGYSYSWIGENYMVTSNSSSAAQSAFDWWMNSTPHRNNILGSSYTQFGVAGVSSDVDWGIHFVIVFARP